MHPNPKYLRPSSGFLMALGVLLIAAIVAKPTARWARATYDTYKASTTELTASESEYRYLLKMIQAQQPGQTLDQPVPPELAVSEKIFRSAISPNLLGRSSQYEPNTSSGKLACARMVNLTLKSALSYEIGANPLYVPSVVAALDGGEGQRLEQSQTKRGDIAIANGTDYETGLWHIGICASDKCTLVLSNSPVTTRFNWLSDAKFDGAFDQYPGKTTFYRVIQHQP
jgi:hypothetical protein